jgi:hypothetical protein
MSFHRDPLGAVWLHCDRPGCDARIEGIGHTERQRIRDAVDVAERKGWQISPHHGEQFELCSVHYEPTLRHKLPVTELYDADGNALPRVRLA